MSMWSLLNPPLPEAPGGRDSRLVTACLWALVALWAGWLACPYLLYEDRSFLRIHDCGDSNVPMAVAENLVPEGGIVGQRNGSLVCGFNHMATWGHILQDQLLVRLPVWLGYGLNTWLQRFVAGSGMLFLAWGVLRFRLLPSLAAAAGYSLFSQWFINASWAGYTYYDALVLPGVPWILIGMNWCLGLQRDRGWLWAAVGAGMMGSLYALTGSYLLAIFPIALYCVWPMIVTRPAGVSPLVVVKWLAVFGVIWAAWCSPFIWAALAAGRDSQRSGLLQSQTLAEGFRSGWEFVGSSLQENWPFALACLCALPFRPRPIFVRLIWLLFGLFLAVLLAKPMTITLGPLLGFLQGFNWQRFYLLLPFVLMITAAAGLDSLALRMAGLKNGRWLRVGWVVACLALIGWVVKLSAEVHEFAIKMTVGGWSSVVFSQPALKDLAALRETSAPFRVATVATPGTGQWHPDMMAAYGLESADGYVPLYPRRYKEFWQGVIAPGLVEGRPVQSQMTTWGNRVYLRPPEGALARGSPQRLDSFADLRLLALTNVRFIASEIPLEHDELVLWRHVPEQLPAKHKRNTKGRMGLLAAGFAPVKSLYVYELKSFHPRFYFAGSIMWVDSAAESMAAMVSPSFLMQSKAVVFAREDLAGGQQLPTILPAETPSTVLPTLVHADHIVLDVQVASAGILCLANSFDPKWRAMIDGVEHPILRANHAFQAIVVPGGSRRVELYYK